MGNEHTNVEGYVDVDGEWKRYGQSHVLYIILIFTNVSMFRAFGCFLFKLLH
jgi:hypothetical protein